MRLNIRWKLGWYNEATYASAFHSASVSNGNGVISISLFRDRWQLVLIGASRKMAGLMPQRDQVPVINQGVVRPTYPLEL